MRAVEPTVTVTTLAEVLACPGKSLGKEVSFVVQFRGLHESWDPYLSRFEPSRWLALEAWPDELFTWDQPVFEHPHTRLFLRRGGGFEPLARRARPYQRFECHARVREVFLGEPWIELLELVPLEGEVGEGTIVHVQRARELVLAKELDLALEQYERARSAPLPPHALAALLEEIRSVREWRERNERPEPTRVDRPGVKKEGKAGERTLPVPSFRTRRGASFGA